MLKSWVAATVLAASLAPAVQALRPAAHACTDHVCACAAGRPSHAPRPESCHSGAIPRQADCQMRSGCQHDTAVNVTETVYLPPAISSVQTLPRVRVIGLSDARRPLAGVVRIDSPPPERA